MWDLWYNFFINNVFVSSVFNNGGGFDVLDMTMTFDNYLSALFATIMVIVIYIICCLCIWKVIKLIGRLFVRL